MNKRDIVRSLMDSIQKADFKNANPLLADDFQFGGPLPQPIDPEA